MKKNILVTIIVSVIIIIIAIFIVYKHNKTTFVPLTIDDLTFSNDELFIPPYKYFFDREENITN